MLMMLGAIVAGILINYSGQRWPFAFEIVMYAVGDVVVSIRSRMATYRIDRGFMTVETTLGVVVSRVYTAKMAPARVWGFLGSFP
ncbi:unnamed protein product [Linum trigynum]|uniref:Major facilitator superfamily (MFS) profile domain-containing protein n=1 Tax=Linum trigynum TaxID=586398 RepID=A0AAV2EPE8_9ROSI